MTHLLYRDDAYLRECGARVVAVRDGGVVLDRTICYARGGGQPGDSGFLEFGDERIAITDATYVDGGAVLHHLAGAMPNEGAEVRVVLDWQRRYAHMRMHSGLHLLGALLPFGVTGGNIGADRSRLDFDMPEVPDRDALEQGLNALIAADHPVTCRLIDDAELDAKPELVRTMKVAPPRGSGTVRLLEIPGVDLQPCGGTHVRHTAEIGSMRIGKIEKKGRQNRRVYVEFAGG